MLSSRGTDRLIDISDLSHWLFVILSTTTELLHAPTKQLQGTAALQSTMCCAIPGFQAAYILDQKLHRAFSPHDKSPASFHSRPRISTHMVQILISFWSTATWNTEGEFPVPFNSHWQKLSHPDEWCRFLTFMWPCTVTSFFTMWGG